MDKNKDVLAEISPQSSVSLLQSSSVHLDPWSLLGLTTLVAAFLKVVSMAPMHGTVGSLWGLEF